MSHYSGSGARLFVVYRPLSDLKPDARNARRHGADQIRALARTIKATGFNVPVLVDHKLKILAGHGRVLAAKELGFSEIPTISLEHLSDAQARAFAIADNRLTDRSEWDERLLAESLKELSELVLDFEIEVTGFEIPEIDLRIASLEVPHAADESDPADEIPAPGPAVSQPEDLWLLGGHRIYCGDALKTHSYAALMNGERAAMVFSDPPYNVRIDGHVSGLGAVQHREFAMASGEMSEAEFTEFLTKVFKLLAKNSVGGSLHYLCMDWRHVSELLAAGRAAYSELKNLCVWTKSNAGMGSLYRSQHELVFVFKNGEAPHRNNVRLGKYGRNRTNVWTYPGANAFAQENGARLLDLHPTVKPVALVADAILDCTARGKIVLDAFLGSGTTVLAAERTGRRCFGLELDPVYVDTAIRRWERMTGGKTRHTSGKTFHEIGEERGSERPGVEDVGDRSGS